MAAFIPIIASLAPSIIQLIAGLVHQNAPIVETNNGPGTGPVKFADLFSIVITALQKAAAVGSIGKDLPSDDLIKMIIQTIVTSMQMQGQLGAAASTPLTMQVQQRSSVSTTFRIIGGNLEVASE